MQSALRNTTRQYLHYGASNKFRLQSSNRSMSNLITEEKIGNVLVLRLNNPKKLNAMTLDMAKAFKEKINYLKANNQGVGAIVLTGEGRSFSAGGDLKFLKERAIDNPLQNSIVMREFYENFLSMRTLPVPIVAAINGAAIGAGLCISLFADVRVAAKDAKMGFTFVNLGLHPGMGATHFLPQLVGPQKANHLLLTGKVISGTEALHCGLVASAVDSEHVVEEALKIANEISNASPIAVRSLVRSLRLGQEYGMENALWREADAQSQCYNTHDLEEGINALIESRKPNFRPYQ